MIWVRTRERSNAINTAGFHRDKHKWQNLVSRRGAVISPTNRQGYEDNKAYKRYRRYLKQLRTDARIPRKRRIRGMDSGATYF